MCSLDCGAGEMVCLLGRNGVGKTTTLKCIMGLVCRCMAVPSSFDGGAITGCRLMRSRGKALAMCRKSG